MIGLTDWLGQVAQALPAPAGLAEAHLPQPHSVPPGLSLGHTFYPSPAWIQALIDLQSRKAEVDGARAGLWDTPAEVQAWTRMEGPYAVQHLPLDLIFIPFLFKLFIMEKYKHFQK